MIWNEAKECDTVAFAKYFKCMLNEGFLIAPSQFEALFVSAAHTEADIIAFGQAATKALGSIYR